MFEEYLEKDLQRKINIIRSLWKVDVLTSMELAEQLEVTSTTIKSDIKAINSDYCRRSNPLIISSTLGYSILNRDQRTRQKYYRRIYGTSLFIKATCFFLKNNLKKTEELESLEYISSAKAYNIRKRVENYLGHLEILENGVFTISAECRIRFLMAFFQWEIGIDIVTIPENNRKFYQGLFKEIEAVERCMFSERSKEYAMILFQICFMRRYKNPIYFKSEVIRFIKNTVVYERVEPVIKIFLEKMIRFSVLEGEVIYLALVINTMNANYTEEQPQTYLSYVDIIKGTTEFKYNFLVQSFESTFNIPLKDNVIFEAALVNFVRKCFFNLQAFIPEEHISSGCIVRIPEEIYRRTEEVLGKWNRETTLGLKFSKAHIVQLTTKLFFILRRQSRPRKIYLLTSFHTDYLLAKEILTSEYGALVSIRRFNPVMQGEYHQDDLILFDVEYEILKKFSSKKLKINYIFDLKELQSIRAMLFGYDFQGMNIDSNQDMKSI